MKTTVEIPMHLLDEARQVLGVKTKTQAIILSLTEVIQRRKSRRILDLKGSMEDDFDYKALRRKR